MVWPLYREPTLVSPEPSIGATITREDEFRTHPMPHALAQAQRQSEVFSCQSELTDLELQNDPSFTYSRGLP
jgi:hypothetical protein